MSFRQEGTEDLAVHELECPRNYDLIKSIHAWVYPHIQPVPEITDNRLFRRVLTVAGVRTPVSISQPSAGMKLEIRCRANVDISKLNRKITFILGLDVDTSKALERIKDDDCISYLAEKTDFLRPYTADSPFEGLTKCILQQQISFRAANVITRRLVLEAASPMKYMHSKYYSFPSCEDIMELGSSGIKKLGVGYKSDYLLGLSSMVASGKLDLEEFKQLPHREVVRRLRPIHGIGDWTIKAFAISSLHDFSVFPLGDLGVRNLLGNLYGTGDAMKTRQVEQLMTRWGPSAPLVLYFLMCADVLGLVEQSDRSKKS
ncbi:MAG: DNA-3-methyladenine glycosylase 2 family protein [Candidatus Thorarchaeota archaeon]|nr:DNA-3-methyladenine glycosylase 2 family protein [Candidatus Thorarchaeota archaeon]